MPEISNIDAIIELIMREARIVKTDLIITRSFMVLGEVAHRLSELQRNLLDEERRKQEDENKG